MHSANETLARLIVLPVAILLAMGGCGGKVEQPAGDDGGRSPPAQGGTAQPAPNGDCNAVKDCESCCAAAHPDAFAYFAGRWKNCGCGGSIGCHPDCLATLCVDSPKAPTADCTECIFSTSYCTGVVSGCLGLDACAPIVACWLECRPLE